MSTHLAVPIIASDTAEALARARSLPSSVSLLEYRLDMMTAIDVQTLAAQTPLPAIFTCRPISQGGQFQGSETARQKILKQALATGYWVDIEMETLPALASAIRHPHRIIGSHHDFEGMLSDWRHWGQRIRAMGAGVVKLVGMAASEEDALPPLAWLAQEHQDAIAIAMGRAGVATRLLAPRFANAFLTFASSDASSAPGQLDVRELTDLYGFQHIAEAEPLLVMLTPDPVPWPQVQRYRQALSRRFSRSAPWLLPIPTAIFYPGLLQALRLARVRGVLRTPGIAMAASLQDEGLTPDDYAWDISTSPPRAFPDFSNPDALMAFFSSGE